MNDMEAIDAHNQGCATLKKIEDWISRGDDTIECPVCGELVVWGRSEESFA